MLCLICVRSGSKGIKNKNLKKINNKTLLQITIQLAKQVRQIKHIVVSTDSKFYAKLSEKYGAKVLFIRPKSLSTSKSFEWDVWKHAVNKIKKKINFNDVLVLPVVSPLRLKSDIYKIINTYKKSKKKTVITVTESNRNPFYNMVYLDKRKNIKRLNFKKDIKRRQDAPKFYDICTIGYMLNKKTIENKNNLFESKLSLVEIPKIRSIDIDDYDDYLMAKILYESEKINKY